MLQSKPTAAEHHICSKWSHQQTDRLEPTHRGKPQGKRGMDRRERLQANVGRAKQQGEETIQLKRQKMENIEKAVQKGGESFVQPVTFLLKMTWRNRVGQVGWFYMQQKTNPLLSITSVIITRPFHPSLTSFLHLCSSLLPVFFLFSETDRTRDACESKDERPAWEGYECVWGEWMILLIPQPYIQVKPPCPNTMVKKLRNKYNSIEVWRSVCMFASYLWFMHLIILSINDPTIENETVGIAPRPSMPHVL